MSTILMVTHPSHRAAADLTRRLAKQLTDDGHRVWASGGEEHDADGADIASTDYVIALGGDGTMLHAVHLLDGAPVPILGINMGHLGYLTEIEPEYGPESVRRLLQGSQAGRWTIDERMMLDVSVTDGSERLVIHRAVNEAVVEKRDSGGTVNMLVRIDDEPFTSYAADGLIVATPTGSTAYSMSARGPIVSPRHRAMLLTPVAPHMLFDRSMVLDPSETVSIEVVGSREAAVVIDGRHTANLEPGAVVRCVPSEVVARFVRFDGTRYHQVLKSKFGLADR